MGGRFFFVTFAFLCTSFEYILFILRSFFFRGFFLKFFSKFRDPGGGGDMERLFSSEYYIQ